MANQRWIGNWYYWKVKRNIVSCQLGHRYPRNSNIPLSIVAQITFFLNLFTTKGVPWYRLHFDAWSLCSQSWMQCTNDLILNYVAQVKFETTVSLSWPPNSFTHTTIRCCPVGNDFWENIFDEFIFWWGKVTEIRRKWEQSVRFVVRYTTVTDSQQLLREMLSRCIIQQCNSYM